MTIRTTKRSSVPAGPHPEQIKALVRMKGISLTQLGAREGLKPSALRMALRRPSPRCEKIIADFLGVHPAELWPERYLRRKLQKKSSRRES